MANPCTTIIDGKKIRPFNDSDKVTRYEQTGCPVVKLNFGKYNSEQALRAPEFNKSVKLYLGSTYAHIVLFDLFGGLVLIMDSIFQLPHESNEDLSKYDFYIDETDSIYMYEGGVFKKEGYVSNVYKMITYPNVKFELENLMHFPIENMKVVYVENVGD